MEYNEQNNKKNGNRAIDTCNGLIAIRGEAGRGNWMKKMKGLVKKHMCMTHGHRQQCGDCLKEGAWVELGKEGTSRGNHNNINNKI